MTETITKRDLIEQNVDKVFPEGPAIAEREVQSMGEIIARPGGTITAAELDAAKALAMAGPMIPEFVRGNPGSMLATMQIAKRFAKYDQRTNSWITFDPIAVASCMYLVEGSKGQSVGYTSQFIGAIIEGFVPWASRMRYRYEGEGETRRCTATALLKGDPEPFEYSTPELRLITPKKSPLWQADPDRQLAYYARRAWARLYVPGVLLGIYDVDELEGEARQHRGPDNAKDITEGAAALHKRMADHAASNGDKEPEGFKPGAVERALAAPSTSPKAAREARGKAPKGEGHPRAAKPEKRTQPAPDKPAAPAPAKVVPFEGVPKNAAEYRRHVEAWLTGYSTEQDIEARWRGEMRLRNQCGLVEEKRQAIRTLVDQRILEVRQ